MAQPIGRQLTKISRLEPSSPSNASPRDSDRARSIAALLNRLALHCPIRNLPEAQAALLMEDTISDLMGYEPSKVAAACDAWRRGPTPFFPTSGQLIALMPKMTYSRHYDPPPDFRALPPPDSKPYKPWRQILAERGLRPIVSETDKPAPAKPAKQEQLNADGALSEERRAQLREMSARLREKVRA